MARTGTARRILPRYLQWFEPTRAYRFRRLVPQSLRPVIGLTEWTETLSPELGEARRLLSAHVQWTDCIIALASMGNWPPREIGVRFPTRRSRLSPSGGGPNGNT